MSSVRHAPASPAALAVQELISRLTNVPCVREEPLRKGVPNPTRVLRHSAYLPCTGAGAALRRHVEGRPVAISWRVRPGMPSVTHTAR